MRIDTKDNGIMIWFQEKDLIFLVKIKWFMGILKILKMIKKENSQVSIYKILNPSLLNKKE